MKQTYETPTLVVVEIASEGVLCASNENSFLWYDEENI